VFLIFALSSLVVVFSVSHAESSQSSDAFETSIRPFFEKNCYGCHSAELKSGGLNLEAFQTAESVRQNRERWEHIAQRLRAGEMPPKGMPRPDPASLKTVIDWIESQFATADLHEKPDPGRVTARRLNRAEYNNTVRDLLGIDLRPADDFPQDDSGYGFDNIGDVLSLSPVLMEKYLSAAEKIARTAVFGPEQLKPTLVRHQPQVRRLVPSPAPLSDYDLTGLSLPNSIHLTHRFPVNGEYVVKAFLGGVRPAGSEPIHLGLWIDGEEVQALEFDPQGVASFSDDRQDFGGMIQLFRAQITSGEHWIAVSLPRLYEGLPASYNGPNPSTRPVPPPPVFRVPPGVPPEKVAEIRKNFEARRAEKIPANDARISFVEIGGPYAQAGGPSPESLKKIYICGHLDGRHQPSCAAKIISGLARRAYRRPVTRGEVSQLVNLYSSARAEGDSFEEGLCVAIEAMLVSPHFLFRIESNQPANAARADGALPISQHDLASRLSYFLWSSMPDDELLGCADRGTLRQPAVLEAQVRRMLKDPRSRALVENFGGQWLELRKLESVKPDRKRFPEFEDYLLRSMRRETELFFDSVVREDRSILDFIDGDYSFINERLARLYQIPNVKGAEFRRVTLPGDSHRSGVLTQASILTVSSYATRTSPVLRGKWILENILNAPPPPPPADVPNLDETKIASAASLRQQLEQHRANPTCASCHVRMDPLGFGLENFDAIGEWRTQEGGSQIDASGTLPDGRMFRGPAELKAIVRGERDAFAECVAEKLLTYAIGRGLERYDKPSVKKIAKDVAANNYRFSSLVLGIVNSPPFQMRREEKER
jgi:uncharacterized protein DUF1592/uncharacterized protein DUF1588/uncharacterized protein DUF1587/uncharacterized protein DUF1585/uncharacterized protein DUF1595/cytochrome c